MLLAARLPCLLLDPRGRMSRGELLVSAAAVLVLEALLMRFGSETTVVALGKGVAFWIGVAAVVKRLHDVGRSGWWALAGTGALCIWTALLTLAFLIAFGANAFAPGSVGMIAIFSLVMLPAIGATLWLHLAPGDPLTNPFGAPSTLLLALLPDRRSAVDA